MPKVKIPAAMNRIYERVWVCMRCNAKIRADAGKVIEKKVKCRKCGYKGLRQKSKERKV
ncbi:MAG TPA: 50S ribosomal protein L40e [archaeon]|nr:50S ribosomal protein L40e [archaeon]